MTDPSTFVGREDELDRARAALTVARAGRTQLLLISGESGIGKSRLAEQVGEVARDAGDRVAWTAGIEDAPPYWGWQQVLSEQRHRFDKELASPFELAHLIADTFRESEPERATVLIFDDLHMADEASLQLLKIIVRSNPNLAVLIVATYSEDQEDESDALSGLIARGERIALRGFALAEVVTLYETITGEDCPDALARELLEASEGHPLFLREAIRSLDEHGLHRPDGSMGFRVPGGARALLRRRLSTLDADILRVLAMASAFGRTFNITLLQEVTPDDTPRLLELLGHATAVDVIEEVGGHGDYAFTQVLLRELLYEDLRASERMKIHAAIADALIERYRSNEDHHVSEIAHHLFKAAQATDQKRTLDYLIRAGKAATANSIANEATRHLRRALKVADLLGASRARQQEIKDLLNSISHSSARDVAAPVSEATRSNTFRREGDFWTARYQEEVIRLKDSKGMRYLDILLRAPGREIHALELAASVGAERQHSPASDPAAEGLSVTSLSEGDPLLDAQAKAAFKERMDDLREEIAEADEMNDPERSARAKVELEALAEHLAGSVGLGGRDRKAALEAERARLSVSKAIRTSLAKIAAASPSLGEHLTATIKTGYFCSYTPDPRAPIDWSA